ncbi:MAG: serine/threonine protein kinase [Bacteriovoracaceae bacterium]|nr:serine/threonine protein kinase [Bacteriovoracaceae bacterium]
MSSFVWGAEETQYFNTLTPEHVLEAVETFGFQTTGRVMQLNSMENRVYEVEIELDEEPESPSEKFKVVKFYRPGRWNKDQIKEEHEFLWDLNEREIPAIAPLKTKDGQTLLENTQGLFFALFPKQGGRQCDEWTDPLLEQMGRLLARLHSTGAAKKAQHRVKLDIENYGEKNLEFLLQSNKLPKEYSAHYENLAKQIFQISAPLFSNVDYQRVHGDCHHGNVLLGSTGPFLIDFDDMVIGPKVQDIWMIIPGRDQYSIRQRNILVDSYLEMADFNRSELRLIETLRALRMIHFSSWIAHRYEDEAFKRIFPTFGSSQYWEKELHDLREQISHIQDNLGQINYTY